MITDEVYRKELRELSNKEAERFLKANAELYPVIKPEIANVDYYRLNDKNKPPYDRDKLRKDVKKYLMEHADFYRSYVVDRLRKDIRKYFRKNVMDKLRRDIREYFGKKPPIVVEIYDEPEPLTRREEKLREYLLKKPRVIAETRYGHEPLTSREQKLMEYLKKKPRLIAETPRTSSNVIT